MEILCIIVMVICAFQMIAVNKRLARAERTIITLQEMALKQISSSLMGHSAIEFLLEKLKIGVEEQKDIFKRVENDMNGEFGEEIKKILGLND